MLCWLVLLLLPLLPLLLLLLPAVALHRCLGASLARLASLQQQVAWGALGWAATWQRYRLEQSTRHAARSQHQALARCLRGARRAPGGSTDMSTFRNLLPLTKPSQAPEEQNGGQEQLPASSQYPQEAALQATVLGVAALGQAHPATMSPGATARVTPASPWPCPLPWLGPILGQAGPPGAEDPRALLLAALRSPGLRALEARTATELLDVFSGLEAAGQELVEAIAAGDPGAPLPGRAAEVRAALERGPRGLALQLWPQLQVVVTLDAGGQAEAAAALRALWCHGLAFFSPAYAASGGLLALNLWPDQPQGIYLLPPGIPFVELLPAKHGALEDDSRTLLLAEAQQGEEYELVLTTHASLTRCLPALPPSPGPAGSAHPYCCPSRCRLGDVIQVVGAHNQCPVVRLGQALSVRGEVTSERLFSQALGRAVVQWPGAKLLDHCCVESSILDSSEGSALHYEVFLELRGLRNLSEENRNKLDLCLQDASPHYKFLRFRGSVGPSHVHLVARGAFSALRAALAARLSSSAPPAMPRVLRHRQLAQLLQRRLLS
ncbi:GH3 domain-containing protein isoform X2 [Heterocephalus glaber]|uniref:GH3 domain-containing protein isoform X2 n=1 Tax=Heterocephalus glaber TaxID=10181 RepID=A0AAX6RE80_HETGA|nr:GH3 domain-containing protein isoform X2 [Heterocephalus glaber]